MKALTFLQLYLSPVQVVHDFVMAINPDWHLQGQGYNWHKIAEWFNQPFKPELVTELFKYFECYQYEYTMKSHWNGYYFSIEHRMYISQDLYAIDTNYVGEDGDLEWVYINRPQTLDHFISDCQRAHIELEFKEQAK